jgi:UrcA family protein
VGGRSDATSTAATVSPLFAIRSTRNRDWRAPVRTCEHRAAREFGASTPAPTAPDLRIARCVRWHDLCKQRSSPPLSWCEMKLSSSPEPWTTAVVWARPWKPPARRCRPARVIKPGRIGRWHFIAAGTLVAGSALAAETAVPYRVPVQDLDLTSPEGVVALCSRLEIAATAVCGLDEAHGYAERQRARRCVAVTLEAEIAELGFETSRRNTSVDAHVIKTSQASGNNRSHSICRSH